MSDHNLTALFAHIDSQAEPALRPEFIEQSVILARRSARRRRAIHTLVTAVILLVVGTTPAVVRAAGDTERPAAPSGSPSLPDSFDGYSALNATVGSQPAGRAVALYTSGNYELFSTYQPLVVGADRDTYRRVDAIEKRGTAGGYPQALLSPDGTHVLVGEARGNTDSLELVDLTTGRRRQLPVNPAVGVRLLAWSPDGRYVAYGDAPVSNFPSIGESVAESILATNALAILDVATGVSTRLPQFSPVRSASFAPDSQRLAVQLDREAWIITTDGQRERQIALPEDHELLARHAWLPGGRLIALVPRSTDPPEQRWSSELSFVDATGSGSTVPRPVKVGTVLGWRSPVKVVTYDIGAGVGGSLVEVDLDTGDRRVLSKFRTLHRCEYWTEQCQVFDVQLATGLLPALTVRHAAGPDRGWWPTWLTVACLGFTATLAALGAWVVSRTRRRRAMNRLNHDQR